MACGEVPVCTVTRSTEAHADGETGEEVGANEKGVLCIVPPLPPGSMTTIWGDDERYVETYYKSFEDEMAELRCVCGPIFMIEFFA